MNLTPPVQEALGNLAVALRAGDTAPLNPAAVRAAAEAAAFVLLDNGESDAAQVLWIALKPIWTNPPTPPTPPTP